MADDRLLFELADELCSDEPRLVEGQIMSSRCLRVGKEFLAMVDRESGGLVVKLPKTRVAELIEAGGGESFAPAGRVFKEWVLVRKRDRRRWRGLLREGIAFVG